MTDRRACYLCSGESFKKRKGKVRDNAELEVLECVNCGLVFLSSFSHIYDGFYRDSKMHDSEIKIKAWLQEASPDDKRRYAAFKNLIKNKSLLDFGCGPGGFLKYARKIASKIHGLEPEARLKTYFKNEKIPIASKLEEINQKFDVITLFHVLEHISDPVLLLRQLKQYLQKKGRIIIEVPNADDALLSLYECEAFSKFTYWSCHLFMFTNSTLLKIAEKAGLKLNYVRQIQRYPLANHLYWLSKGKPGGHKEWSSLISRELNEAYEKKLTSLDKCDTIIASFSR